jgi:hypothetical protein
MRSISEIKDDNALQSQLLDISENSEIIEEVKFTTSLINPQFDFRYFDQAVEDVWKLFRGQYPGYRACNTLYHDLRHTMLVLLAMARLIHGAYVQGISFTDKEVNMGLITALMHDTGYIQTNDDNSGTGAKYTLIHIKRSIMFVHDYYEEQDYFRDDLENFSDILNCTGINMNIKNINFSSVNMEIMGKILGTADLLGQMADRLYLEKLVPLFREFAEGKVPGFHSELDLLQKTTNFYHITRTRFEKDLGNVNRYMVNHFRERWNVERNLYDEAIEKSINYLKFILKSNEKNVSTCLRRNTITIQ